MKILVIGGTGTVGGQVVRDLLESGVDVRVLTRSEERARALPEGVQAAIGDLEDPASLPKAFEDIDRLFLNVSVGPKETEHGITAVNAAKNSEVTRIVYSSVVMPTGSGHIPHFVSKVPIEDATKSSGLDWTILRPSNFYQNDTWLRQAIVDYGVYPQPIGNRIGINRVDVRDIADAAATALLEDGYTGRTYQLQGPAIWTGNATAELYTRTLGREVRYMGDDLDAWAREASRMLPDYMIEDFKIMFKFFQEHGCMADEDPGAPLRDILKHEPRRFEDFVSETARQWAGARVG
jgi:uncharacterized protein YbjT (DUF2867 family)